ncbi:unnamed protein product [Gordionus sp. m RMFG-2023]
MHLVNFLILVQILSCCCLPEYPDLTYHILFTKGVEAYHGKEWYRCISFLKRSIEDFKFFHNTLIKCYRNCLSIDHKANVEFPNFVFSAETDEYDYFHRHINNTLCLIKCRNKEFSFRPLNLRETIDDAFENFLPYDYLQYCFYKIDDIENAIAHAYTYYLYNPDNDVMKNNLKLYQNFTHSKGSFKNLELEYHHEFYMNGIQSYLSENWFEAIDYFEEALTQYYKKDNECRLLCHGPYKKIFNYDFITTISNIYALRLKCNRNCIRKLNTIPGERSDDTTYSDIDTKYLFLDDYLRSHYHYLQFAYFKTENWESAAKNVATYFVFDPFDDDMMNNKRFYLSRGFVNQTHFTPRQEAILYHNRHYKEALILNFIEENFNSQIIKRPQKKSDSPAIDHVLNSVVEIPVREVSYYLPSLEFICF